VDSRHFTCPTCGADQMKIRKTGRLSGSLRQRLRHNARRTVVFHHRTRGSARAFHASKGGFPHRARGAHTGMPRMGKGAASSPPRMAADAENAPSHRNCHARGGVFPTGQPARPQPVFSKSLRHRLGELRCRHQYQFLHPVLHCRRAPIGALVLHDRRSQCVHGSCALRLRCVPDPGDTRDCRA
jgi:hypothetical protein